MAKLSPMVATVDQINKMLANPIHGLTNELLIASIEEGFELAHADIAPSYVSIIVKRESALQRKVWNAFSDLFCAYIGSEENEYRKYFFSMPYTNSLMLSLNYFVSLFHEEIISGELEVRLENKIGPV